MLYLSLNTVAHAVLPAILAHFHPARARALSLSLFSLSGESLVPYYRQLLPIFNLLKAKNKNSGDVIDYAQRYYGSIKQAR